MDATTYDIMRMLLGGVNPKSVNNMESMSSWLFNPQYGVTGDTYESAYTLPAPYTPNTPRLDAYLNSANPVFRDVASGIASGQLDEASAVAALYNGLGFSYDTEVKQGLSLPDLRSAVKEMFDERERDMAARIEYDQNLLDYERNNLFGKAGLPQPNEQWDMGNMPISDDLRAFMSRLSQQGEDVARKSEEAAGAAKLAKFRRLSEMLGIGNKVNIPESGKGADGKSDKSSRNKKSMPTSKPLGEGVSPLGEGVPPLGSNVRPLGEGVRPLGEGVRPLGEGVSPMFSKDTSGAFAKKGDAFAVGDGGKGNLFVGGDKQGGQVSQEGIDLVKKAILSTLIGVPQLAQDQSVVDQQAADAQRRAMTNQAIASLRLAGEKIGLDIQGRTPLEEALRRRALGISGM